MGWEFVVLDALQGIHTPLLDKIMVSITSLGNVGIFWILSGLILVCIPKTRKMGAMVLLALIFSLVTGNILLKNLIQRDRPCWINDTVQLLVHSPKDFSFPSGHTQASFASATAIFMVNRKAGICAFVLGSLIAFSRLYLYVHFPTDVLAGMVLGILCGFLSGKLIGELDKRRKLGMVGK